MGGAVTAEGGTHAFITGPDGVGMRDLGTLGGITAPLLASTMPGKWWDSSRQLFKASTMLLSPVPTVKDMTDLNSLVDSAQGVSFNRRRLTSIISGQVLAHAVTS